MVNHKCDPLYDMDESEKEDEEDEVELRSGRSSTVRSAVAAFSSTSSRENPSGAFWFVFSLHFLPSFLFEIECLPPIKNSQKNARFDAENEKNRNLIFHSRKMLAIFG